MLVTWKGKVYLRQKEELCGAPGAASTYRRESAERSPRRLRAEREGQMYETQLETGEGPGRPAWLSSLDQDQQAILEEFKQDNIKFAFQKVFFSCFVIRLRGVNSLQLTLWRLQDIPRDLMDHGADRTVKIGAIFWEGKIDKLQDWISRGVSQNEMLRFVLSANCR